MSGAESKAVLNRVIHEPARLAIVATLYVVESADFTYLAHRSGLTDGNLSSHLAKLEQAGYVDVDKSFEGRRPRTIYTLNPSGRRAFDDYREALARVLDPPA